MSRSATVDTTIAGYSIPKGTDVIGNLWYKIYIVHLVLIKTKNTYSTTIFSATKSMVAPL